MKSLEKVIIEMAGQIKQKRAEFRKGQKDLLNEIRELKEELTTHKRKVIVL